MSQLFELFLPQLQDADNEWGVISHYLIKNQVITLQIKLFLTVTVEKKLFEEFVFLSASTDTWNKGERVFHHPKICIAEHGATIKRKI